MSGSEESEEALKRTEGEDGQGKSLMFGYRSRSCIVQKVVQLEVHKI